MLIFKITNEKAYDKLYNYYKRHPNKQARFKITNLEGCIIEGLPNITYEAYDAEDLYFRGCKIVLIKNCDSISGIDCSIQCIHEVKDIKLDNSRIHRIIDCQIVVLHSCIVNQVKKCRMVYFQANSVGCFSDISYLEYYGGRLIAYTDVKIYIYLDKQESDLIQLYDNCIAYNLSDYMPTIELYNYSTYIYSHKPEKEKLHINSPLARVLDRIDIRNTYINNKFYKVVNIIDGEYSSIYDHCYIYNIGEECDPDSFSADPNESCSNGIHLASQAWCFNNYNIATIDALLEFEICGDADICIPYDSDGKIRVSKAKCIREVPREEWDVFGGNI